MMGYIPSSTPIVSSGTAPSTSTETWSGSIDWGGVSLEILRGPSVIPDRELVFASEPCPHCGCCAELDAGGKCKSCGGPGK